MSFLDAPAIAGVLKPYLGSSAVPAGMFEQLRAYLLLLERWNERTNLTAVREPLEVVRRHFGESLFAGLLLPADCASLLDYGSGAGFPGLPIQLLRPELAVTLAESQGKKATFLREVVRELGLKTEVWAGRVEALAAERVFDAVTLRAVDKMELAVEAARTRVRPGGVLVVMGSERGVLIPGTKNSRIEVVRC